MDIKVCFFNAHFAVAQGHIRKYKIIFIIACTRLYHNNTVIGDGNSSLQWSACGSCPRGSRADVTWACSPCQDHPTKYDWMYLCFMSISGLLLQWYSIDSFSGDSSLSVKTLVVHVSALLETLLSAVITLIINEPVGSLNLKSCAVRQLSDWYTQFHNPQPNYQETLYCAQEAVYPLYSLVFIHYGFSILLLLTMRPLVNHFMKIKGLRASRPIYFALYIFPILSLLHATLAGLVYYAYPSIIILLSLMSHAFHFASRSDQSARALLFETVSSVRNLCIVLGHWLLHAYGLTALTMSLQPELRTSVLSLVPLPTLLYIALARFTDPVKFHSE
nr:EOG090X0BGA [Sida crystallina]